MKTEKFDVNGMTCSSCVAHVEKSVSKLNGIKLVQVNLLTNRMTVSYDENALDSEKIKTSVKNAGYDAQSKTEKDKNSSKNSSTNKEMMQMKFRWWISLVFLVPLLYLSMGHMLNFPLTHFFHTAENAIGLVFTQFLLTLPIVYVNKKYFITGFKTLFKGAPNMDSLIAIGSSAAIFYGIYAIFRIGNALGNNDLEIVYQFTNDIYFESGATILTLITLGKYLEAKSKSRTSDAITKLINLIPITAIVIRENIEIEIPVEDVNVGDVLIVKPGQSVPVDGMVESGYSSVDESALTGESMPVFKQIGDKVLSASINKSGYFTLNATKVGKDTTLSQIIKLVEEASSSKAPISKLADKISSIFVPVVIGLSIVSTIVWLLLGYPIDFALSIGIAVLVISCPCALGLATPVAIMVGMGKGAEHGILIKTAESLETAYKIDTIVLDKTGTLTEGKPCVTDIYTSNEISENQLLQIAASIEKKSEHPLAEAILKEAETRMIKIFDVENFEAFPGFGIQGKVNGMIYLLGNLKFMESRIIHLFDYVDIAESFAINAKTPLFISNEKEILGIIAVADILKPTSKDAVNELISMGINVVMLTGDNAKTAAAIQHQLGISTLIAEVLPQDKDKAIIKLQSEGNIVAMVGDGINDAPALMRANLGIAIGAGSDIAIESADVILINNDLLDVVNTIRLSKVVITNIKQNLFWAFFYNIIGIPLAAGVFYSMLGWKLNPMFAAAAMSLSSLTVVLNALRIMNFKSVTSKKIESVNLNITINNPENIQEIKKPNEIMSEKTLLIKGMSCGHCSARVEKVLNSIDGVEAKVDLESNSAKLLLSKEVSNEIIKASVDNIGYEVVEIK